MSKGKHKAAKLDERAYSAKFAGRLKHFQTSNPSIVPVTSETLGISARSKVASQPRDLALIERVFDRLSEVSFD